MQTEIIDDGMALNKDEFMTLGMLYATTIDGKVKFEDVKVMLMKCGFEMVDTIEKMFAKMSDVEVHDCMFEDKALYTSFKTDVLTSSISFSHHRSRRKYVRCWRNNY